jgi:chromosome segregation ATPase
LVVALVAAIVGPLVAYVTASRKLSGKIDTSDADKLWAESASIRDDYRGQLQERDKRIAALEKRVTALEQDNNNLIRENLNQASRISAQATKIEAYERRIEDLLQRLEGHERGMSGGW